MKTTNLLLSGIVGSTAYGLATPDSDVDRLGVFAAPTVAFHGLSQPNDSIVTTKPDNTLHEAKKYIQLALRCNPSVLELLWLADELYETTTELGYELVRLRRAVLSARLVRDAYLGYAQQQASKLRRQSVNPAENPDRVAKHARHLARLLVQGRELYAEGVLRVRVGDPQLFHDFGAAVAGGDLTKATLLLARTERDFDTIRSPLPDRPDEKKAERWLLRVRREFLDPA